MNASWMTAAYSMTKYAVVALSEGLRNELRDTAIGVSVLCPAAVQTQIAVSRAGGGIAQHVAPRRFARRPDVRAFDQAERQNFRALLLLGVERISHEMVPTRPPSTNTVLPVV